MTAPALVLFDMDGTLVDSAPDIAYCVDCMLADFDLPALGEDAVRRLIGRGAEWLVTSALETALGTDPRPTLLRDAHARFIELYDAHADQRTLVYPGVIEGLEALASRSIPACCVTNKPARFTSKILKSLELERHFGLVLAGDSLPRMKPDPMPLLHAAAQYGAAPAACLMIGDSASDVLAARAAGCRIFCVSYGYNHGQDIRAQRPDRVIDTLATLSEII